MVGVRAFTAKLNCLQATGIGGYEMTIWRRKSRPDSSPPTGRDYGESPAQRWMREQNSRWAPPSAPEPPAAIESAQDRQDRQDGIRARLVGGPCNGKAVAPPVQRKLAPDRGYAPNQILEGEGLGPYSEAIYIWDSRQPDGVHVYTYRSTVTGT